MNILYEVHFDDGIRILLIEQAVANYVILSTDGDLSSIGARVSDFARAKELFNRAVEIAAIGFTHPAWKRPGRSVPINTHQGS